MKFNIFEKGKILTVEQTTFYKTPIYKEFFVCEKYTLSLMFRGIQFFENDETPCFEIGLKIQKTKERFFIIRTFKNYNSACEYFEGWMKTIRHKVSDREI